MSDIVVLGLIFLGAVGLIATAFIARRAAIDAAKGIHPDTLPIFTNLFESALDALYDTFQLLLEQAPDLPNTDLDDRIKELLRIALDEALKKPVETPVIEE